MQARPHRSLSAAVLLCFLGAGPASAADPAATAAEWSLDRSELEVRNLLNRWLRAQNSGDFAAYAPLHAGELEAVRGTGKAAVSLDREKWMHDRERLFLKPMQVRLFFVESQATGDSAEVSFVQSSEAAGSREASSRTLGLRRSDDRFLITSDQIRMSRPLPADRVPAASTYFRLDADNDVVLWEDNVAPPWLPPKLRVTRPRHEASQAVAVGIALEGGVPWKSLPDALSRWSSRRIALVSTRDSSSCHLTEPIVTKRWFLPASVAKQMSDTEVTEFLRSDQVEVWTLHAPVPDCNGLAGLPAFARVDEGDLPPRTVPRAAPKSVAAAALATFKKLPQWPTLSREGRGAARALQMEVVLPKGKLQLVALAYDAAKPGCGAWALWKVDDGRWELLNDPGDLTYFYPQLATDIDGDGKPELFGGTVAAAAHAAAFERAWSASGLRPADGSDWIPYAQGNCED